MKLYWFPHSCAIGIHVVLEETGAPYTLEKVDPKRDASELRAVNPKGKVPALERDDGSLLTEYSTIASWLGAKYKSANLLPFEDLERQTRMYEAMDYAIGTVHGKAFGYIFHPESYTLGAEDQDAARKEAKSIGVKKVEEGFEILGRALGDGPWLVGEQFTIGDTALFYMARWAPQAGVRLPANIADHLARMKQRPSVAKVLKVWGES